MDRQYLRKIKEKRLIAVNDRQLDFGGMTEEVKVPEHFKLVPLPREILCWLTLLLQRLPMKKLFWGKHTRAKHGYGEDGKSMSCPLELMTTSSLIASQKALELSSWEPLPWLSTRGDFLKKTYDSLAEGTSRSVISYVAQAFRKNNCPNITKDKEGKLDRLLLHQSRAFKNEDPKPKQQKELPMGVLQVVAKANAT
eukprot:4485413-Ditylum_brightwellii.AAC.1